MFENGWCPLSNNYSSTIYVREVRYRSVQQMYQALKAKTFGDLTAYTMIMKSWSPKTQSEIGSTVDNFNCDIWQKKADTIMEQALRLKFKQNLNERKFLLDTGKAALIFASKYEPYWGNGLSISDEGNADPKNWQGRNRLGELLMKIRDELISGNC